MDSIIISLIPTAGMLLLGAILWYTDPEVRVQRARARKRARARRSVCVGCGETHTQRNACDDSFSAFCTETCHDQTMV